MMRLACLLAVTFAATGCSSPPQAPTVDDTRKRPVNVAEAIELQSCRSELAATKIVLAESLDRPRTVTVAAPAQATASATPPTPPNHVFVIRFGLGSSAVDLSAEEQARLAEQAKAARFIVIRGRTDASSDSFFDTNLARRRAEAAYSFLTYSLKVPLPPEGIRTTWQGAGDRAAPGQTLAERQANRRVEIELYPVKPDVQVLATSAS
jgi:outer membrane protein OmpA-like peptidoglycan-associated protein